MNAPIARAGASRSRLAQGKRLLLALRRRLRKIRSAFWRTRPDLVFLGTSNCIGPKSFVSKIANARRRVEVQNLSVGACSSAVGLYMLDLLRPSAVGGIAILDYATNDTDAAYNLWGEANAAGVIAKQLRRIVCDVRAHGFAPVLMVMPACPAMSDALLGERIHLDYCLKENLNFLNLRALFQSALTSGASESALMRDDWHMSERASELFAGFLLQLHQRLRLASRQESTGTTSIMSSRVVVAEQLFRSNALVKRNSSLRSAWYGRLTPGEKLIVPVGEHEQVAGIMVNVGAPGGTIAIRGANREAIKSLTFAWSDHKPVLFFSVLVDVAQSISGGPDGVTIEIVPDDRAPTEPTLHGRPAPPPRNSEVEIEGVLVTSIGESEVALSGTNYPRVPLDLSELPEAGRLLAALSALTSPAPETG